MFIKNLDFCDVEENLRAHRIPKADDTDLRIIQEKVPPVFHDKIGSNVSVNTKRFAIERDACKRNLFIPVLIFCSEPRVMRGACPRRLVAANGLVNVTL